MDTASARCRFLKRRASRRSGFFVLPGECWLDNYYTPLQQGFDGFLRRHNNSVEAQAIVNAERHEIELFQRYHEYYSYGFYIARKL
jgi:hypothetical protein